MIRKNQLSKDIYEPFLNFRKNIQNLVNDNKLPNTADFQNSLKQIVYINQEIEMILVRKGIENFELSIMRVGIEFICEKFNWKFKDIKIKEVITNFLDTKNTSTSNSWKEYFTKEMKNGNAECLNKIWWNYRINVIDLLNKPHHPSENLLKQFYTTSDRLKEWITIFDIYKNLVKLYLHYHNHENRTENLSKKLMEYNEKNELTSNDKLNLNLRSFTSTYDFLLNWNNCNKYNDSKIFVPFYQRKFMWKKENIALLFKNIIELKDNESHFIGNIYLYIGVGDYNKNIAELLDGQQRVISIELFLKTIYSEIKNLSELSNKNEHNEHNEPKKIIDNFIDYKKMDEEVSKLISNKLNSVDNELSYCISQFKMKKNSKTTDFEEAKKLHINELKNLLKRYSFSAADKEINEYINNSFSNNGNNGKETENEKKLKSKIKLFYLKNLEKKIMYNLNFFVNLFIGNSEKDSDGIPEIFINLNTTGMKLSISEVCFAQIFSKIPTNIKNQENRHLVLEKILHKFFEKYKKEIDKDNFIKLLIHSAAKKKWILGSGENNIFKIFKNEFLKDFKFFFSNDTSDKYKLDFENQIRKIFHKTDNKFINYSNLYIFMFLKYNNGDDECLKYHFWKIFNDIRRRNEEVFRNKICKEILYIIISRYFFQEKYDFDKNELQTENFFKQIGILSEYLKKIIETKTSTYTYPLSQLKTSLIHSEQLSTYNPPYNKANESDKEKLDAKDIYIKMKEKIVEIFEKDLILFNKIDR